MSTKLDVLESGIYSGKVFHKRSLPKIHQFEYSIYLFWLKLDELTNIEKQIKGFSVNHSGMSLVNFKRSDYLGNANEKLDDCVRQRMSELAKESLHGDVFMLGQVRTLGMYFSPVNFYFLRNDNQQYTHMLAEVSNTPWNERHHYLVNLDKQDDSIKAFHVSPFNPIDMIYKWRVQQPSQTLALHLSCYQQQKQFEAALDMQKQPLTSRTLRNSLLAIPSMTIKTVVGIYWHALKLFLKRVPIYTHP